MEAAQEFLRIVAAGNLDKVKEQINQEPDLVNARSEQNLSAVLTAMYHGHTSVAVLLSDRGARLDIFEAAAVGRVERIEELLLDQPDLVNSFAPDGFQPLGLACFFRQAGAVRLLIEHGAEVSSPSRNPMRVMPLHSAAAAQDLEIARALLEHGAQVNAAQAGGFTPLHAAAQNGQIEMITLLINYGADPGMKTENGQTPRDLALESNHVEAAKLLP